MKTASKTIVITGAGSGIGRATAQAFLAAGWRVGLIGRREAALRETAGGDGAALVLPCDVTKPAEVDASFAKAAAVWGHLDALFNNAGMSAKGAPIDEIPVETWLQVSNVNITGMFLCARAAFGQMRHQSPQGGRIINNGSISAHVPRPGSVPYTVSKHAVTGLTRTLGLDGRAFNIACGQIDIGNALTDMARAQTLGGAAGRRADCGRADDGCGRRGAGGFAHGSAAAGCERALHDDHGARHALYRAGLGNPQFLRP